MTLLGYTDRLSVNAGEVVELCVTTDAPSLAVDVVRLTYPDDPRGGRGLQEQVVLAGPAGLPGRQQTQHVGSFASASCGHLLAASVLSATVWVWPTTPALGRAQGILSHRDPRTGDGWGIELDVDGRFALVIGREGEERRVSVAAEVHARRWHRVEATLDRDRGRVRLDVATAPGDAGGWEQHAGAEVVGIPAPVHAPLAMAASTVEVDALGRTFGRGLFNGKLEAPQIHRGTGHARALVVGYDFAQGMDGDVLRDVGPPACHGRTVNLPTRAMTGHGGVGAGLGAIHFHDDDADDLRWTPDCTLALPAELESGIYAARVRAGPQTDRVPFVVCPPVDRPVREIVFLAPTFTYLAYANTRLPTRLDFTASGLSDSPAVIHELDHLLARHPELGASLYDLHSDGSGICYASARRPIVGLRPEYGSHHAGEPRHLGADLYLVDWLEHLAVEYDVLSDHELHRAGVERLAGCRVLVTGSHPEYWSAQMLDAVEAFLRGGGRLMYLGGNGFYWVTSVDPARPWVIEVRRGLAGTRAWESEPGETDHATTGEAGGIWRHRGRPPNRLCGVGFTAQGWGGKTPGFRRLADSRDPRAAFIFAGVADDGVIGEHGLVLGGAAGDEVDRFDVRLGTPPHALRLATSQGRHSEHYRLAVEDVPINVPGLSGATNDLVRADMTYFETGWGGAVFSVGSISWAGALSHDGFDNDVARITSNVLRRFADPEPL